MLTPEQIEGFRLAAGRLIDPVNTYLLKDIARRVQEAGKLTSTAAYEAWQAEWLGKGRKELERELSQLLGVSRREARKLLHSAARYGYDTTLSGFPGHLVSFDTNLAIQQIVSAAVTLAGDGLRNITQTKAILMMDPYGHYQALPKAYLSCTDYAFQQVFTGAVDYSTAIRQACAGIAKHGVSVAYTSGVHTSLEAAVRRNIMGGLGLMTEQISRQNHDDLGCNGWEISAHANSAPDHEPIQGRQYSDEAYDTLNNSLVRRIGTLNCGHVASPIILGVNSPQYSAEDLEGFRQDNEAGVTFDGKHYTGYEATQMQRRLERAIRAQKRRVLLAGPEDAGPCRSRLMLLQQEYERFSKGVGLRTETERLEVSGFGPKQMQSAKAATPKVSVENARNCATMKINRTLGEDSAVHQIGRIDIEKYRVVTEQIQTDEVIITDTQIEHIRERHPETLKDLEQYAALIVEDPDYILENRINTGLLLKEIEKDGKRFQLALRLCVATDPDGYKNSIITFTKVRDKEWKRLLRNKKILYKKE